MIQDIEVRESEAPTSPEEIRKFEKLIKAKLPSDYKQFLLKHNGGHPINDTHKLIDPINEKNHECGINWFYALYDGEACNIVKNYNLYRGGIPNNLLPIASATVGVVCLGLSGEEYNKLYYWLTNWSCCTEEEMKYLYLISESFAEFINGLYEFELDKQQNIIRKYPDGTVTINEVITAPIVRI